MKSVPSSSLTISEKALPINESPKSIVFQKEIKRLKEKANKKKNFSENDRKRLIDLAHRYGDPSESIKSELFEVLGRFNFVEAIHRKIKSAFEGPGIIDGYKKRKKKWIDDKEKEGVHSDDLPALKKVEFVIKESAYGLGRVVKSGLKTIAGTVLGKFSEFPGVGDMFKGLGEKIGVKLPEHFNDELFLSDGGFNKEAFKKWPVSHSLSMLGSAWIVSPAVTLMKIGAVSSLTTFLIGFVPPLGLVGFTVITIIGTKSSLTGIYSMGEKTFLALANMMIHGVNHKDNSIESLQDKLLNIAPFIGSLTNDEGELREMIRANNTELSADEVETVLRETQKVQNEIAELMKKAETLGLVQKKNDGSNKPLDQTKKNPFADPVDDTKKSFLEKFKGNNLNARDGPKI